MTSITTLLTLLFLAVDPFWIERPPSRWSDPELYQFLTDSPWAQMARGTSASAQPVLAFIATSGPMLRAEEERERRGKLRRQASKQADPPEDPLAEEYKLWLEDNRPAQIVLAIRVTNTKVFSEEKEIRRMEDECIMKVGRQKIKMSGHFPPTASDPYLRLAFPRSQNRPDDKSITFELYLPGVNLYYRNAEFTLKDMIVDGRLEL